MVTQLLSSTLRPTRKRYNHTHPHRGRVRLRRLPQPPPSIRAARVSRPTSTARPLTRSKWKLFPSSSHWRLRLWPLLKLSHLSMSGRPVRTRISSLAPGPERTLLGWRIQAFCGGKQSRARIFLRPVCPTFPLRAVVKAAQSQRPNNASRRRLRRVNLSKVEPAARHNKVLRPSHPEQTSLQPRRDLSRTLTISSGYGNCIESWAPSRRRRFPPRLRPIPPATKKTLTIQSRTMKEQRPQQRVPISKQRPRMNLHLLKGSDDRSPANKLCCTTRRSCLRAVRHREQRRRRCKSSAGRCCAIRASVVGLIVSMKVVQQQLNTSSDVWLFPHVQEYNARLWML